MSNYMTQSIISKESSYLDGVITHLEPDILEYEVKCGHQKVSP